MTAGAASAAGARDARASRMNAREKRGYWFWGPVALVIFVTEVLGIGKIASFDEWPTISTTIGDLQDRHSLVAVAVVALIALAAFYAVAYQLPADDKPQDEFKLLDREINSRRFELRYGVSFVVICALLGIVAALSLFDDKIARAWVIYGTLALVAVVIPLALALLPSPKDVVFPNLFYTFACLRERWQPATAVVVAGLAILVLHLALYPWPDLARESARFAGVTPREARGAAESALGKTSGVKPALVFSTAQRSVANGDPAWHVYFHDLVDGERVHKGCYVVVAKGRAAVPSPECSR
jgi:hypothetical protein